MKNYTVQEALVPQVKKQGTESTKMPLEEIKKLVAKIAIVLIAAACLNWLWLTDFIPLTARTIVVINLLLAGGLVASYLHGNPSWSLHTKLFVLALILFLVFSGWTKLEHNRKAGDNRSITQKMYDSIGNWVDPQIPPAHQAKLGSKGGQKPKIVFIGEYTDADISEPNDDGGWVPTFDWAKIRTGSATVIEGKIPPGCKQIFYYRGEQFKPQFLPTINGSKKIPITSRPANGKFMIWIQKGKGIKATVKVIDV